MEQIYDKTSSNGGIDLFKYVDISEEQKERITDYIVTRECDDDEDFMLFQEVVAKAFSKLFSMIEAQEQITLHYQTICSDQARYIDNMIITEATEREKLEENIKHNKEKMSQLETQNSELQANCKLLRGMIVDMGLDKQNSTLTMSAEEARLAKYIINKEERQQLIVTLKQCKKAEELSDYLPTMRYETEMPYSDITTKEFREAIMPFLGYKTTDGALKKVIQRALKK